MSNKAVFQRARGGVKVRYNSDIHLSLHRIARTQSLGCTCRSLNKYAVVVFLEPNFDVWLASLFDRKVIYCHETEHDP